MGHQLPGWGGPGTLFDELLWTLLLLPPPKIEKKEHFSHKNLNSEMVSRKNWGWGLGEKVEGQRSTDW